MFQFFRSLWILDICINIFILAFSFTLVMITKNEYLYYPYVYFYIMYYGFKVYFRQHKIKIKIVLFKQPKFKMFINTVK